MTIRRDNPILDPNAFLLVLFLTIAPISAIAGGFWTFDGPKRSDGLFRDRFELQPPRLDPFGRSTGGSKAPTIELKQGLGQ